MLYLSWKLQDLKELVGVRWLGRYKEQYPVLRYHRTDFKSRKSFHKHILEKIHFPIQPWITCLSLHKPEKSMKNNKWEYSSQQSILWTRNSQTWSHTNNEDILKYKWIKNRNKNIYFFLYSFFYKKPISIVFIYHNKISEPINTKELV